MLVTQPERYAQWDVRFGWWAMWHSGSPAKVGEYQDLNPSPFWDVDGFSSNGTRTLGVTATGSDQETTLGKLYYYQPGVTAKVDYERFLHELDHDPLSNMQTPTSASRQANPCHHEPEVIKQDLGVGQDYAVRVQELKASFKGIVATDNLKVRLDVWGLKKDGTRQVNAVAMCYTQTGHAPARPSSGATPSRASRCHVLSQPQQIDWTTTEIKPVIEARLGDSHHRWNTPAPCGALRPTIDDDAVLRPSPESSPTLPRAIRIPMPTPSCRTATRRWTNSS